MREILKGILCFSLLFFPFFCFPPLSFGAGFGQNKIIIRDFRWKISSTEHFDIYYYDASEPWLRKAAEFLEKAYRKVTGYLGHEIPSRRPFFLYASASDMKQTNVVPNMGDGVGGVTEPFKNRFVAYADGSESWLEDVITHEFTHVVQFSVLVDGFWRSARIVKTIVYPLWMMEGLAEYSTGVQDKTNEDLYVRDAATSGGLLPLTRLEHFGHLKPHQMTLAYKESAQVIRFLASEYGEKKPGKMLKLFKNRFEAGSVLGELLGIDYMRFDNKFREYLEDKYARQVRLKKLREPTRYGKPLTETGGDIPQFDSSPVFSPDGGKMFFISTRDGYPPGIYAKDLISGRVKGIVTLPCTSIDNIRLGNFLQISRNLAVSPDGRTAAFAAQKNNRESIYLVDLQSGNLRRIRLPGMAAVGQPSFSPDGNALAFSAIKEGFTDIFLFNLKTGGLEQLTHDFCDDQSPSFSPDGRWLVYSSEINDYSSPRPHRRDLRLMNLGDRSVRWITGMTGSERDPVFSPGGKKVLYVSDPDFINELYETDLETSKTVRLTRTIGGNFTPVYLAGGEEIAFASFRKGSINIYRGRRDEFLSEAVEAPPDRQISLRSETRGPSTSPKIPPPFLSEARRYRFKPSTDLFLPAFFFSSQGGLFWTSYWQASDMLGNHGLSLFVNYSSGQGFLNYEGVYRYGRFRPQWILGVRGLRSRESLDESTGLKYDGEFDRVFGGAAYPFDRYHRMEVIGAASRDFRHYEFTGEKERGQGRLISVAAVRDTSGGKYLVATRGSRARLELTQAVRVLGGSQKYSTLRVEAQKFIPAGGLSTLALRFSGASSTGPEKEGFELGGVRWVRGFQRGLSGRTGSRFALCNVEYRFPILSNLNYYMWYIFPDLYFKAVFGTVFTDLGHVWDYRRELKAAEWRDLSHSVGLGVRVYSYILQQFQIVLALDFAKQLTSRNYIWYFYLGPLF